MGLVESRIVDSRHAVPAGSCEEHKRTREIKRGVAGISPPVGLPVPAFDTAEKTGG